MIGTYTSPVTAIPAQMIPYKKKVADKKQWAKECVDGYETLGRRQYSVNMGFLENYQMLNGRFIWHHYFEEEGYKDWLTMLNQEFEIPSTLRHYDIIGKVVNNLTEKLMEFPDVFRVEEKFQGDDTNEYVRTQTDLMHKSLKAQINTEIKERLIAEGYDPDNQNFESEEQAMQYYQEMQDMAQAMEPSQIQFYMNTEWQSQGEIWGMHQIELDRQRYRLWELERKEFKDMLITDRCYRHFFLTGESYMQETWNPITTFSHESPDLDWVEDGDYVGRMLYFTKADIIQRYGWKMKDRDIKKLEQLDKDWRGGSRDLSGFPYKVYAPFEDYKSYVQVTQNTGYDPINNLPLLGDDMLTALTTRAPYIESNSGLYRVTEVYWKSQKKVGKYVYIDEETGLLVKMLVDENFVVPEGAKQKKGDYYTGNEPFTVYWTYVNEVWKGTKICFAVSDEDAIYLDMEPLEFQFKGDYSPYGCKLPVCGRVFNNRNAQSMSLVDFMKPHQIGYNVCMNQLYQLLEKEIGTFVVWDTAFFNTMKDWGGEDSWEKVALVARELGHVFGDTSPQNMKGANPNNTLPKIMNMELTAQMMSRARLAEFFEMRAMAQVGVTQQLMGDVKATETATGIQTGVNQSQLNVQKYYTDFFEYKQRCLTMGLDIAQYVQSHNIDATVMYTKSDASRVFLQMNGTELLLRDMHVYVVNSQELLRHLEMIRNLFVNNNTTNASPLDLVEVITSNSPAAIKVKLKEAAEKQDAMQQQAIQQQQQAIEQQGQVAQMEEQGEETRNIRDNQTKENVAYIQVSGRAQNSFTPDTTQSYDALEYNKLSASVQNNAEKTNVQRESNQLKRDQISNNNSLKQKELALKERDMKRKEKESKTKFKIAKENKTKYDK